MLRLAHISDTHLGKRQYGSDLRKQDYLDAFEESIDQCIDLEVHAVIHTGDLFDDPSPDIETLDETIRVLSKLEAADIPFYGIVGNHERKRDSQWMDIIQRLSNTHRLTQTPTVLTSDDGDAAVVYGFDAIRKPQWESTDFSVTPPPSDTESAPKIACFHELFTPPLDEITADYELQPVLNELNINPTLVALGDNHMPQEETVQHESGETVAYYPGSTEKTSRNDPENHFFTAIGIEDDEVVNRSQVQLETPRKFITVEINFEDGDGVDAVDRALSQTNFTTPPDTKNPVGVLVLKGESTGVTHNEIKRVAKEYPVALLKIDDKRQSSAFQSQDIELDREATDIETAIDEALESVSVSEEVAEIEAITRDTDSVVKSNVREEVNSVFTDDSVSDTE